MLSPPNEDSRYVMQFGTSSPQRNNNRAPNYMFSENLSSPDEKRRKSIRVASAQKSVTKGGIFSSQNYIDKNNVSGDYYGMNYSDMKVSASYNPRT